MKQGSFVTAEEVWESISTNYPKRILNAFEPLRNNLKQCYSPIAKVLLEKITQLPPSNKQVFYEKDMNKLIDELISLKNGSLLDARNMILALGFIVQAGRTAMLWNLPLPPIPVYIKRERNPYQPKTFLNYQPEIKLQKQILSSIYNEIALSEEAQIGRILLSAVANGGLLHKSLLESLLSELDKPLVILNNLAYVNLPLKYKGHENQEFRRWFIDPTTKVLFVILNPKFSKKWKHVWPYIKAFYNDCSLEMPKSITSLIKSVAFGFRQKLPPFLVVYQSRGFISHSLHESVWHRLQNLEPKYPNPSLYKDEYKPSTWTQPTTVLTSFEWCFQMKTCLKASTKKEALHLIQQSFSKHHNDDVTNTIIGWAAYMLKHGSKIGRPLALSTINGYVSRVIKGLPSLMFNLDIQDLTDEDIEEVYTQLLENTDSTDLRKHLRKALQEFHRFLCKTFKHLSPNQYILNQGLELSPVDTNIINLDEYFETLTYIKHSDIDLIHEDLLTIARLLVIIGFRCGLRRSEALKLRLIDIHEGHNPEILIRPHKFRRLKTSNAVRRIPVKSLLDRDEINEFLTWLNKRKIQEKNIPFSEFLFAIPSKSYETIPAEKVFAPIHHALRQVTGDKRLRYHHLRHSFASWSLIRLIIADYDIPKHFFDASPRTRDWLFLESKPFKSSLYNHDEPTRKHLYFITTLLGHSNPSITLEYYIHFCDILSVHALTKFTQPLDATLWSYLLNMPRSTVYTWLKSGGENKLFRELANPERTTHLSLHKRTRTSDITNIDYKFIMQVWKMLFLHSAHHHDIVEIAKRYKFTVASLQPTFASALYLAGLKTQKGSYRHKFMSNDAGERLLCPTKPTTDKSIALTNDFAGKLSQLYVNQHEDLHWIINYFVHHARKQSLDLLFHNPDDANRYLSILSRIGIKQSDIILTWYYGKTLKNISNTKRKSYWRKSLNLSKNRKLTAKRLNNTSTLGEYGWAGIRLRDYLNPEQTNENSTYAFRFVFLMCAIIFLDFNSSTKITS